MTRASSLAGTALRLLPGEWRQPLTVVLELQDLLDKPGQVVIDLQQRVKVAGVANILQAAWHAFLALTLLRVERLVGARADVVLLLLYRLQQHLIHFVVLIVHARDALIQV